MIDRMLMAVVGLLAVYIYIHTKHTCDYDLTFSAYRCVVYIKY